MTSQLKITESRRLLQLLSEPFVVHTRMGFQPAIDVEDVHSGERGFIIISAVSLGEPLHQISTSNEGKLAGRTVSIRKESSERMSKYIVTDSSVDSTE